MLSIATFTGADIQFAYGYVDLQSPGQVPYEVVVGLTRDPVMLAALRVSDVAASAKFFTDTLGMQQSNMPLARTAGSLYERQQPADSVYLSYGPDSMGVLLLPPATLSPAEVAAQADLQESSGSPFLKFLPGGGGGGGGVGSSKRGSAAARRINVGNLLDAFTIVVDDGNPQQLPPAVRDALEKAAAAAGGDGTAVIQSPDGYPFRLKPYSIFTKEATKSVPVP